MKRKKFNVMQNMKCTLLTMTALLGLNALQGQNCNHIPQANAVFEVNNITAIINNDGTIFTNNFEPGFKTNVAGTIFSAGLWIGGTDLLGNVKLSALTYQSNTRSEYTAGPLDPVTGTSDPTACVAWDKVFSVRKATMDNFTQELPSLGGNPAAAILQFPSIMGWPGMNNPHFESVHGFALPSSLGLAPFIDQDGDAVYNPLNGDLPAVMLQGKAPFIPAQIIWCVFNDEGNLHETSNGFPILMEVQLTAWAFDTAQGAPYSNTIFTSYKLINRSTEAFADAFLGMSTDFDLGCYQDDYIGCNTDRNTFFAYNQDNVDGQPGSTCQGTPTFGEEIPVQTVTFLNKPMDRFIYFNNASVGTTSPGQTDPEAQLEYLYYLQGLWRDGLPLTFGQSGYNPSSSASTNWAFPDDPSDPNGWSMCSANLPFGDRRALGSTFLGDLFPGGITEVDLAWTMHPNIPGPCGLGNSLDEVDILQDAFDDNFSNLVPVKNLPQAAFPTRISPNPASQIATLEYPSGTVSAIFCYDAQGKLVKTINNAAPNAQAIELGGWANGVYSIRLVGPKGVAMARLVVQR
jgi:hypothetical protein